VIAKINDPLRAAAYADLGINTLCRTNLMATAVSDFLGLGLSFGPGMAEATGHHPGGEHHADDGGPDDSAEPAAASPLGGAGPAATEPGGPGSAAGTAPPSTPSASSDSTQAPALPVAGREG
jgi:hypothetical protein